MASLVGTPAEVLASQPSVSIVNPLCMLVKGVNGKRTFPLFARMHKATSNYRPD